MASKANGEYVLNSNQRQTRPTLYRITEISYKKYSAETDETQNIFLKAGDKTFRGKWDSSEQVKHKPNIAIQQ